MDAKFLIWNIIWGGLWLIIASAAIYSVIHLEREREKENNF
jgi:hypothetical protein